MRHGSPGAFGQWIGRHGAPILSSGDRVHDRDVRAVGRHVTAAERDRMALADEREPRQFAAVVVVLASAVRAPVPNDYGGVEETAIYDRASTLSTSLAELRSPPDAALSV